MKFLPILLVAGVAVAMPANIVVTTTTTITTTPPPQAPLTTPAPGDPSTAVSCHYRYCDGATSWCFYWAGITAYDLTYGPIPGERRTEIGSCDKTAAATTATTAQNSA